jgi:hypothetical protein
LVVGHFGFNETMELMFRDYWWLQLWKFMKEFVGHVMFVLLQRILIIAFMDFFNHYWSLPHHGLRYPWISSWIFHDLTHLIPTLKKFEGNIRKMLTNVVKTNQISRAEIKFGFDNKTSK